MTKTSYRKFAIHRAALLAVVLGAAALVAGCVYEEPAYPSYAAAYPGYPGYYGGYPSYPAYDYGPTVGLGFRFGGDDWHEHHGRHHEHEWH